MPDNQDAQLFDVVQSMSGRSFSTFDLAVVFQQKHPSAWNSLIARYGKGGKGAGKHYTANSYLAQSLGKLARVGQVAKLNFRTAPEGWGSPVIQYWTANASELDFPEDVQNPETVVEGAKQLVTVNKYERSHSARLKCIDHWGVICCVCGFNFEDVFGARGAGFVHVHHLTPLSEIGAEYQLDPVKDLRPVCPNCHAMLHRSVPAISIEELKALIHTTQLNR